MKALLTPDFFPDEIEGERIVLRRNSLKMVNQMFAKVCEERGRLREFLPWVDRTKELRDEVEFIELTHQWWQAKEAFEYAYFRKSDEMYLGHGGAHTIDWQNEHLEIGYLVWQEFEGQGYVSDLVTTLEKMAFQRGFFRVEIRCDPKNIRSADVARRLGYQQEGHLRGHCTEGGRRRDTLIFGKIRTDK
jgi:RimJ/RimL family protein N-acetyltransferase